MPWMMMRACVDRCEESHPRARPPVRSSACVECRLFQAMPATPPERMTPRRACVVRPFGRLPSSSLSLADDMRLPSEAARALLACARRADSNRPDPIDPNHPNHDGSEPSEAGFVAGWMGLWVHIFLSGVCIHVCVST